MSQFTSRSSEHGPLKKQLVPRPARLDSNQHLREIAAFLRSSGPQQEFLEDVVHNVEECMAIAELDATTSRAATWVQTLLMPLRTVKSGSPFNRARSAFDGIDGATAFAQRRLLASFSKQGEKHHVPLAAPLASTSVANFEAWHDIDIREILLHGIFKIPVMSSVNSRKPSNASSAVCIDNDQRLQAHDKGRSGFTSVESQGYIKTPVLEDRYFILHKDGHIFQYPADLMTNATPEKAYHVTSESIAVATDAIPGQLWCLRLSQLGVHASELQSLPSLDKKILDKPAQCVEGNVKDMLFVFGDMGRFETWMFRIRAMIEEQQELLADVSYTTCLSDIAKPRILDEWPVTVLPELKSGGRKFSGRSVRSEATPMANVPETYEASSTCSYVPTSRHNGFKNYGRRRQKGITL